MARYWVFASSDANRARLHLGSCMYCRDGRGPARRLLVPGGPQTWTPFATVEAAQQWMDQLHYKDKSLCKTCMGEAADGRQPVSAGAGSDALT